jgi:ferredoxin-NADP reductase
MTTYSAPLLTSETCGGLAGVFRFRRPDGYLFNAGQHLTLGLQTGEGLQRKVFTIASAPADDYLEICTRLSGSVFKTTLAELVPGDEVELSGSSGTLTLAHDGQSTGFLVGGVGVTPAHSMIRDAMAEGRTESLVLFYGDRSPECMKYADEFAVAARRTGRLTFVPVVERPGDDWSGETGFITEEVVRRYVSSPERISWILSGPPMMVQAMQAVAARIGIPDSGLQVELFSGYPSASRPPTT